MSAVAAVRRVRTFDSLRHHRNYRLYFSGQIISITGTWLQNVAQQWIIVLLTHSALAVGVLALCQFGPYALLGLLGGSVTDRLDNRRTLVVTQSAAMGTAAVLAVLTLAGHIQAWEVYVLAAVYGLVLVVDTPTRQNFTIQMVGRDELPNAVALNSSLFNASRILGPALGGVIIAGVGAGWCFALNAVSYIAVVACLVLMRPAELIPMQRARRDESILSGVAAGLRHAWRTPRVLLPITVMLVVGTISINFNVLLPVLASRTLHGDSVLFGVLSASFGAGALVGALVSASLARADLRLLLVAAAAFGAGEVGLAFAQQAVATCLLLAALGVSFTVFTSNTNSTVQLHSPDAVRGRVLALYAYVFFGTAPVGGLLAGWLSERGGTRLAFMVAGTTAMAMAAVGAVWARKLAIGDPRRVPTAAAVAQPARD